MMIRRRRRREKKKKKKKMMMMMMMMMMIRRVMMMRRRRRVMTIRRRRMVPFLEKILTQQTLTERNQQTRIFTPWKRQESHKTWWITKFGGGVVVGLSPFPVLVANEGWKRGESLLGYRDTLQKESKNYKWRLSLGRGTTQGVVGVSP